MLVIFGGCKESSKLEGSNGGDYFNRKQTYSFNCQAVCDGDGLFLAISPGWPGAFHDARILGVSGLKQMVDNRQLLVGAPVQVEGALIKPYLLGDSGYPLYEWLITPHPSDHLRKWRRFNYSHSRSRIIIEKSFGMLKRRFAVLATPITFKTATVNDIFVVCCILHNLIAKDVWQETTPTHSSSSSDEEQPDVLAATMGGHHVRDILMKHVTRD